MSISPGAARLSAAADRSGLRAADVVLATGDTFVTDVAVRDQLARDAHLVDMEGFAIAYAAASFGASVRLVKHVLRTMPTKARWVACPG